MKYRLASYCIYLEFFQPRFNPSKSIRDFLIFSNLICPAKSINGVGRIEVLPRRDKLRRARAK